MPPPISIFSKKMDDKQEIYFMWFELYTVQPRLSELQGTRKKVRIIGSLDMYNGIHIMYTV